MDATTVLAALEHWHALNLITADSLKGRGEDCKFYPNYRHVLAWDIDAAITRLPPRYRVAANAVRFGGPVPGRFTLQKTCEYLAEDLRGVRYEF